MGRESRRVHTLQIRREESNGSPHTRTGPQLGTDPWGAGALGDTRGAQAAQAGGLAATGLLGVASPVVSDRGTPGFLWLVPSRDRSRAATILIPSRDWGQVAQVLLGFLDCPWRQKPGPARLTQATGSLRFPVRRVVSWAGPCRLRQSSAWTRGLASSSPSDARGA